MYVLQATNTGSSLLSDVGGVELTAGQTVLFPADGCVFTTSWSESKNAYEVSYATHFVGALVTAGESQEPISQAGVAIQLGYISKTGRFVAMTS